jgi:hypothetical protein
MNNRLLINSRDFPEKPMLLVIRQVKSPGHYVEIQRLEAQKGRTAYALRPDKWRANAKKKAPKNILRSFFMQILRVNSILHLLLN